MTARLTTKEFVRRAREVHGKRFDYSQVDYQGMQVKVQIICRVHGVLEQTPVGHLAGYGCSACSRRKPYTTATFAAAGRKKHNGKYTYELVEYVSVKEPVWITCRDHGPWLQKPGVHLSGHGCMDCGGSKPHTTESFIWAAREVHGDDYGYDLVEYGGSNKVKVLIRCPEHGIFEQSPNAHLRGNHCPACMTGYPLTVESFIERAREVHGEKFDYSLVEDPSWAGKVTIICRVHGVFLQTAGSHLGGTGCAECAGLKPYTTETFIAAAREVHGDRFSYAKAVYQGSKVPLTITCPVHGDFQQKPNGHLSGEACAACSGKKQLDTDSFIEKARAVHGDRFDYSQVDYVLNKEKVRIICRDHGGFEQAPSDHLAGKGCRRCRQTAPERQIALLLDEAGIDFIPEFRHPTLRYHLPLSVDFFIPEYRTIIEYDGPHHRGPIFWRHDSEEEAWEVYFAVVQRDIAKTIWAKEHRLRLIRLSNPKTIEDDLRAAGILD